MNERDLETLKFVYDRLKYVYHEKVNYDYMLGLKSIIERGKNETLGL